MDKKFSNLTILYVEDEAMIRQNAVEYLGRICKHVFEAEDGFQALQCYHDNKPDIIISDIKMPRMNGLEMARKIRQNDKNTPIIIATAHTETSYLLQAVELQLIKYIIKPITSSKLKNALSLAYEYLGQNNIIVLAKGTIYDTLNKTLIIDDMLVKLTKNEHLLLDLLAKNHQRAVSYQEIENLIWSDEGMSIDSLRSLIRSLRKKLQGDFIENVSGVGYRCKISI